VIPPKSNRKTDRAFDKELYKAHHIIEKFFCKIKHFRLSQHAMTKSPEPSLPLYT
jgi:transposase